MQYNMNPYFNKELYKCKKRMIKVNGQGMVQAEPDVAIISVGIVTKDKNPQNAQTQNYIISQRVINALLQKGIAKEDIKTASFSIFPEYDFVEGQQILSGYNATHILEVKVRDLDKVGEIIVTATANGANQINNVVFTLEDSKYYYNRALKLAVKDAASKAQTIAETMKVSFDSIPCTVTEQSTSFTPLAEQTMLKATAADVVMPGKIEIKASVEAEFEFLH